MRELFSTEAAASGVEGVFAGKGPEVAPAKIAAPKARMPFIGVEFDVLRMDEVLQRIFERDETLPFAPLVTPNADHVYRINKDRGLIALAYRNAWMCINDSKILAAMADLQSKYLPAVPGADVVKAMLSDPRLPHDAEILVVGGDAHMVETLRERTGLTRVTHYNAPMGLLWNRRSFEACVEAIERNPARFVFIAVGSPQQELLAATVQSRGNSRGIGLCIGASLEFLTCRKQRAPQWMRSAGLEWLHRLCAEPKRMWRRYLVHGPAVIWMFLRDEVFTPPARKSLRQDIGPAFGLSAFVGGLYSLIFAFIMDY